MALERPLTSIVGRRKVWTGSRKRRSSSQTPLGCIARAFLMPSSRDFGNGELYYFFSFSISFPFPRVRERWGPGLGCPRLAVSCLSAIEDGSRERSRKKNDNGPTKERDVRNGAIDTEQKLDETPERSLRRYLGRTAGRRDRTDAPFQRNFHPTLFWALLFMFPFFSFSRCCCLCSRPAPSYTFATTRPCYAAVKARAETAMSTLASFALMSLSRAPVSDHGQQKGWRDGLLPIGPSSVAFSTARIPPLRALPFSPRMAR